MFLACFSAIGLMFDDLSDKDKELFANDLCAFVKQWRDKQQSNDNPNAYELEQMTQYKCGDPGARVRAVKHMRDRCCNGSLSLAVAKFNEWYEKLKSTL